MSMDRHKLYLGCLMEACRATILVYLALEIWILSLTGLSPTQIKENKKVFGVAESYL